MANDSAQNQKMTDNEAMLQEIVQNTEMGKTRWTR